MKKTTAGKYITLEPIDHDGKRIAIGSTVNFTDAEAKPLIELGAIVVEVPTDRQVVQDEADGTKSEEAGGKVE